MASLTPDDIERVMRLEGILMPSLRAQRDRFYTAQTGGGRQLRCAHYTSAEAALQIIKSKRVWMRSTTCMSDYSEVQHGLQLLHHYFADEKKTKGFVTALDECAPGAARTAIDVFNRSLESTLSSTYVVCLSEQGDGEDLHGRLSMWRAFGGSAGQVALVFKIPWFSQAASDLHLFFSPVTYLTEDSAIATMDRVIENVRRERQFLRSIERELMIDGVFAMFLASTTCVKHEGFREEKEWRAIYSPKRQPSPLMESAIEPVRGVPQVVYKIPLDASKSPDLADLDFTKLFDSLIIGPSPYASVMVEAFVEALRECGVQQPEQRVVNSGIPIRA